MSHYLGPDYKCPFGLQHVIVLTVSVLSYSSSLSVSFHESLLSSFLYFMNFY